MEWGSVREGEERGYGSGPCCRSCLVAMYMMMVLERIVELAHGEEEGEKESIPGYRGDERYPEEDEPCDVNGPTTIICRFKGQERGGRSSALGTNPWVDG